MNPIMPPVARRNDYPTSDGRPMAETDWHRDLMNALIETLKTYYEASPSVYVSGNLLLFYERGNRRRHVSPDVFVVRGVAKYDRPNYLLWEEKPLDLVIEITSSGTRREDVQDKFALYRDTLHVKEYFLFDPDGDYLDPPLRGHRLDRGRYRSIRTRAGRLPSQVLGLHLERAGQELRLYNPATGERLPTQAERIAQAEAERDRLRREVEELRRRLGEGNP
jgi:Uma2 family endonuclease